jgi:isopentenyl diphosphate isomerase/L-lactate dehydrogenase-like FMN-dependent dehydrogenase
MEVKGSEAQGRHREVGSEGSVEQTREALDKKRIRGLRRRASGPMIAKPIFSKDAGGKSDGCAWKAIELISGEQLPVTEA